MLNTTEKTVNIWLDTLEKENVYLTLRCMSFFFSRFSRFNLIRVYIYIYIYIYIILTVPSSQ